MIVPQYSSSKITVFVWGKKYAGFLSRAGNQLFLLAIQTNVTDFFASEYRNKLVQNAQHESILKKTVHSTVHNFYNLLKKLRLFYAIRPKRQRRQRSTSISLPCLLSIPLTAREDSHHSLRHSLNMASTRGKSKGQINLPNLVSVEVAKKWIVKINKMALHKSVSSVFLIISDKMTSLVQSSTDQSSVFL